MVGVGAVVVDRGRVLLVRRGSEPMKGHWSIPGGLVELGETMQAAVVREIKEETGLEVEPVEVIEVLDRILRNGERVRYHYVIVDYLCRLVGGELQAGSDAEAARWFERAECQVPGQIDLDEVALRVIDAALERAQILFD